MSAASAEFPTVDDPTNDSDVHRPASAPGRVGRMSGKTPRGRNGILEREVRQMETLKRRQAMKLQQMLAFEFRSLAREASRVRLIGMVLPCAFPATILHGFTDKAYLSVPGSWNILLGLGSLFERVTRCVTTEACKRMSCAWLTDDEERECCIACPT